METEGLQMAVRTETIVSVPFIRTTLMVVIVLPMRTKAIQTCSPLIIWGKDVLISVPEKNDQCLKLKSKSVYVHSKNSASPK